jgi:hypothetical protein
MSSRHAAALALVLLAPTVAELLGGATQITQLAYLLVYIPLYGAGALLIRELVRRGRAPGWASILLLGAAFGLVEEGLALQSLFNPSIYSGAADWGARILGVNGVYAEVNIGLHAVWSAAIPILLTDLLFPELRAGPYLGRFGLAITAGCYVMGVLLVSGATLAQYPFMASPVQLLGTAAVAVALGVLALRLPARSVEPRTNRGGAPSPWRVGGLAALGTLGFIGLLLVLGRAHLAWMQGPLVGVPMLVALVAAVATGYRLWRWSQLRDFGDRHLLALAVGAVVVHTLLGDLAFSHSEADAIGRGVLLLLAVAGLVCMAASIRRREEESAVLDRAMRGGLP